MDKQEEDIVRKMTFQQRLKHFSPLLAEHKITWKEFSYIVKEIPYEPNRSSENLVANKESGTLRTNSGKQRREVVERTRPVEARTEVSEAEKALGEEPCTPEMERPDSVSSTGVTNGEDANGKLNLDGQGGKESDFQRKVKDIATLFSSG